MRNLIIQLNRRNIALSATLKVAKEAIKAYMFVEQTNGGNNPHLPETNKHRAFELGRKALATIRALELEASRDAAFLSRPRPFVESYKQRIRELETENDRLQRLAALREYVDKLGDVIASMRIALLEAECQKPDSRKSAG